MLDEKSWLEVEMQETVTLLRKKLEKMNNMDVDCVCNEDIEAFKNLYKTLFYIKEIKKESK